MLLFLLLKFAKFEKLMFLTKSKIGKRNVIWSDAVCQIYTEKDLPPSIFVVPVLT